VRIRAATRGSALARWQTDRLIGLLNAVRPEQRTRDQLMRELIEYYRP